MFLKFHKSKNDIVYNLNQFASFSPKFPHFQDKRADKLKRKIFCCTYFENSQKNKIRYLRQSGIHPDIRNWRMLPPGNGNDVDSVLCKKKPCKIFNISMNKGS